MLRCISGGMGTYQLDHGLSIIEDTGSERMLNIAPMTVRGNMSLVPKDMKIELALKLYEFGMICLNDSCDQLRNDSLSIETRNEIASDVLWKHYGTDNVWEIMTKQSLVPFIHVNDLHNVGVLLSDQDNKIRDALLRKLVEEH